MTYDSLLESVGAFGTYQKKLFAIFFVNGIPNALLLTSIVFLHYIPDHHCSIDHLVPENVSENGSELLGRLGTAINFHDESQNISSTSSCRMRSVTANEVEKWISQSSNANFDVADIVNNVTTVVSCPNGHDYDRNAFVQSAMMEFNGVCENAWYKPFISSLYLIGMSVSALAGFLSDKFGRRPVFLCFTLLQFLVTFATSFATDIRIYGVCLLFCGLTQMINYMAAFVLGTECTTPDYRNFISVSSFFSFSVGYMIGPLISYFIPNWRWLLRFNGLVGLLYIPMYWLVPESPRWLLAKGRVGEAKKLLLNIAKENGQFHDMDTESIELIKQSIQKENEEGAKVSMLKVLSQLVRNPSMLLIVFVIEVTWCAAAIVYFGLSLSAQTLDGNLFINCLLLGALEIPGTVAGYLAVRHCSRPKSHALFMFVTGSCCLAAALLKTVNGNATAAAALLGKGFNSAVYYIVYIHTAEVAPTVTRNSLMCIGSTAGRIGAVVSPYFVYMLELHGFLGPYLTLSAVTFVSALLTLLFLPETRLQPLPETVKDTLHLKTVWRSITCKPRQQVENPKVTPESTSV